MVYTKIICLVEWVESQAMPKNYSKMIKKLGKCKTQSIPMIRQLIPREGLCLLANGFLNYYKKHLVSRSTNKVTKRILAHD